MFLGSFFRAADCYQARKELCEHYGGIGRAAEAIDRRIAIASHLHIYRVVNTTGGRILSFEIGELKLLPKGGRGLTLIDLDAKDQLAGAAAYTRSVKIEGIGRGGKAREETLEIRSLNNARAARARKGKAADLGFKPASVVRVQ